MIKLKSKKQIKDLKIGGEILSSILNQLSQQVKHGMTTNDLEKIAQTLISQAKVKPSFQGFHDYPAALCTSVNEELVHGLPSERKIKSGDIVSIDCGIWFKKLCTDMALTVGVDKITPQAQALLNVTKESLLVGLEQVKPGNTIGDYGWAVQQYVENQGLSVIRGLVGHGVGFQVHEEPRVPNFGQPGNGVVFEPGMVLALEPMVSILGHHIVTADDGWTISMQDNSLSAHFEVTIAVTTKGFEYLTPPAW